MIDGLKDLFLFMKENKKWWLLPILLAFVIVGTLVFVSLQVGPVTPFIYSFF